MVWMILEVIAMPLIAMVSETWLELANYDHYQMAGTLVALAVAVIIVLKKREDGGVG